MYFPSDKSQAAPTNSQKEVYQVSEHFFLLAPGWEQKGWTTEKCQVRPWIASRCRTDPSPASPNCARWPECQQSQQSHCLLAVHLLGIASEEYNNLAATSNPAWMLQKSYRSLRDQVGSSPLTGTGLW